MFVIKQPLPAAPAADFEAQILAQWNAVYDAYNEMKEYVEQLEHLGYVLSQDINLGLILNGHTSDFAGFVRNYNMHNMGKTVGALHALLIEYEKGLLKKAATPKPKNPKPSTKERPTKDDACHHCKEVGHWKRKYHVYLAKLIVKKKQVGNASSSSIFTIELFSFLGV
ncbi:retrotransposon protein, putative, ty1-copia subclass [Tanacetum coccineum]